MRLRLHPAALVELDEAVDYLEQRRVGFGELLFDEVTRRIAQAARWPRSGRYDVRHYVVERFHYLIITAVIQDERIVIAVAHTSREPGYWRDRLK